MVNLEGGTPVSTRLLITERTSLRKRLPLQDQPAGRTSTLPTTTSLAVMIPLIESSARFSISAEECAIEMGEASEVPSFSTVSDKDQAMTRK